nr:set1 complex component spp1 [Quercus suber]
MRCSYLTFHNESRTNKAVLASSELHMLTKRAALMYVISRIWSTSKQLYGTSLAHGGIHLRMDTATEVQASGAATENIADTLATLSPMEAQSSNNDSSLAQVNNPLTIKSSQPDGDSFSPLIKQEPSGPQTPHSSSPHHDMDNTNRAVSSLKNEHGLRPQSPLRESSIPVPSTEMSANEQTVPAKRPAPSRTKKGTATATKKAPQAKRRKLEQNRSATPSSRTLKPGNLKIGSNISTPVRSSPARSSRSSTGASDDEDEDEDMSGGEVDDDNLYCICKKPDNGTFMIGCDGPCEDWFHGKCVNIQEKNKNLIDKFICPNCMESGEGRTTFKRMCRRQGCRQPARTVKSKSVKDVSKYCSNECGVQFFRELAAKTRGQEDVATSRSTRRKGSTGTPMEDDSEARGGVLSASEVKALLVTSKTATDFRKLGEGVLSPPTTPDEKGNIANVEFTDAESFGIQHIHAQKEEARRRHQLQKDRLKFITMIKQAASRVTAEKELKPRDYCGYDSRLEWTPEQFAAWRESTAGNRSFENEELMIQSNGSRQEEEIARSTEEGPEVGQEVCDRKKCLRHLDWAKMMVDGLRAEMTENSDHMRALEQEEKSLRGRVALRAKCGQDPGAAGTVESHDDDTFGEDIIPSRPELNQFGQPKHVEHGHFISGNTQSAVVPDVPDDVPKDEPLATVSKLDISTPMSDMVMAETAEPDAADAMNVDA